MLYTIILPSFFLEDKHYAEGLSVTIDEYVVNLLIVRMHKGRMCHCLVYHSSTHESHLDVLRNMFHKMASDRRTSHSSESAEMGATEQRAYTRAKHSDDDMQTTTPNPATTSNPYPPCTTLRYGGPHCP